VAAPCRARIPRAGELGERRVLGRAGVPGEMASGVGDCSRATWPRDRRDTDGAAVAAVQQLGGASWRFLKVKTDVPDRQLCW
jgi:hypothetical protein